jgi:hypothetical protein
LGTFVVPLSPHKIVALVQAEVIEVDLENAVETTTSDDSASAETAAFVCIAVEGSVL